MCELLFKLLELDPDERCASLAAIEKLGPMSSLSLEDVLAKKCQPPFTPPKDHLNCDPTFELEEMIIETKPLHKKKKRLAKQR